MKSQRTAIKTTKYFLANIKGVEVCLSVPARDTNEQRYYLDYKSISQKKYYGKGIIKTKAVEFFSTIDTKKLTQPQIESLLSELYADDLEFISNDITQPLKTIALSLHSELGNVLIAFYTYKEQQHKEGTVDKVSMYGYKHHNKKLTEYFKLPQYSKMKVSELNSSFWLTYRIDLINNAYNIGKRKLKNSSVNQHFQYVTQFYTWLIDYNELPIRNHLKKLKRLSEAQHDKRFKVISNTQLSEFYQILETKEKYRYTRLYLAGLLLYENNIRLSEQVLIRLKDVDLEKKLIVVLNKKNDSIRTVVISEKAKELIGIIINRTVEKGITITDDMYIIGGYNRLKPGMPLTHKELGILMREFRIKYPQFKNRTLYEHKHTSITNQFDSGVEHYKIKERANHSSISTTEIYLQANRVVLPFELNVNSIKPLNDKV